MGHQLEHGVEVCIAPVLEAVEILLVAHQRETGRGAEFEAVLDRKLLVDCPHHGEDFDYLTI